MNRVPKCVMIASIIPYLTASDDDNDILAFSATCKYIRSLCPRSLLDKHARRSACTRILGDRYTILRNYLYSQSVLPLLITKYSFYRIERLVSYLVKLCPRGILILFRGQRQKVAGERIINEFMTEARNDKVPMSSCLQLISVTTTHPSEITHQFDLILFQWGIDIEVYNWMRNNWAPVQTILTV